MSQPVIIEFDPIVAQWAHLGSRRELPRTLQVRCGSWTSLSRIAVARPL